MNPITLRNTFHNTETRVRTAAETPAEAWYEIQATVHAQVRPTAAARALLNRVWRALCGNTGCACGVVRS